MFPEKSLGEHHFRDAGFEMALPEMAGDADQAVLLLIPSKADAIIRLKARLISPEDGGAVLLFEDHRAAEIGCVGLQPLS